MIYFKSGKLSKKEETVIFTYLEELPDSFRDFYITKNNLRLFLKSNPELLSESLENGDKLVYGDEEGLILITGWSDKKYPRKYVKILAVDEHCADKLLKVLSWHIQTDLYIKIKKLNPLLPVLKRNNYRFVGNRGVEELLCRKYIPKENKETTHARKNN